MDHLKLYNDKTMYNSVETNAQNGYLALFVSFILSIPTYFSNLDIILKVAVAVATIGAAALAGRYHYYAAKEKKERLKRLKNNDKKDF